MEGDSAENGHAIDIAIEHLSGEKEEGAIEDNVENGAVEVTVVHKVLVDLGEGVEDCEGLCVHGQLDSRKIREKEAYLCTNMLEIHP